MIGEGDVGTESDGNDGDAAGDAETGGWLAAHVRTELAAFADALRAAGVAVPADGCVAAAEALAALDAHDRERVRAAVGATLRGRPDDDERFEALFGVFWTRVRGGDADYGDADGPASLGTGAEGAADAPGQTVADEDAPVGGASGGGLAGGVGSGTDAGSAGTDYSTDGESRRVELDGVGETDVDAAVATLTDAVATEPGRRWTAGAGRPDVARALRRGVAHGGVPPGIPERERARTVAEGVVLVDVSGSVLDALDRDVLLAFCRAVRERWRDTPVYFFDTALRDVSNAFDADSTAAAVRALEAGGVEWGGGTRIGDAVTALRERGAVERRDTVLLVSDGVERGGTEAIRDGMAWLARRAGRVCWLNPLAADPQWSPAAPGMRAALPYLDGCYAFADAADLDAFAADVAERGLTMRAVEGVA